MVLGTSEHVCGVVGNGGAMGTSVSWSQVSESGPFTTCTHGDF